MIPFAHFSGKEALVFDEQDDLTSSLTDALIARPAGTDAMTAMENWFLATRAAENARAADPEFAAFRQLVDATPALLDYWRSRWRDSVVGLAQTLATVSGVDDRAALLTATLVVEGYLVAAHDVQPDRVLGMLFRILRSGLGSNDDLAAPAGGGPADHPVTRSK